ncbi:hypothetical protein BDY21DRAFT_92859 [Lineolata rhizophorae]|uniref:Uncharacterized protein n=1 Tax=Lineolata rhizophorae TaxID=578093 RepID=A0A6A6PCJ7_9PEZI|nr:hypothetical protein BDY21DRAFT_92859 [Lineolata rhizophorae]
MTQKRLHRAAGMLGRFARHATLLVALRLRTRTLVVAFGRPSHLREDTLPHAECPCGVCLGNRGSTNGAGPEEAPPGMAVRLNGGPRTASNIKYRPTSSE